MSEDTKTCPNCGNELAASSAFCPHCGTRQDPMAEPASADAAPEPYQKQPSYQGRTPELYEDREQGLLARIFATTRTHTWWWAGGGGTVVVATVLAVLVFGGFLGPSGKAICVATLSQARDFGVVPYNATLSSSYPKSTDVDGRKQCTAQADDQTYIMTVDVKKRDAANKRCKDFKKQPDCLALFSVGNPQGMMTYQYRQPPNDDQDAAAVPPDQSAGAPAADQSAGAAPGGGDQSALGADTTTGSDDTIQTAPASGTATPATSGGDGQ